MSRMDTLFAMPARITAGTTVSYSRTVQSLPDSAYGWKLQLDIAGPGGQLTGKQFAISSMTASVLVSASDTETLPAGDYRWQETCRENLPGTQVFLLARGGVVVDPNLADAAGGTLVSFNASMLALLKARVQGRLTADQESVQVNGTAIVHIPFEVAERLLTKYQQLVDLETNPQSFLGSVEVNYGATPMLPGWPFVPPTGGRIQ